jgi:hypothetical protein
MMSLSASFAESHTNGAENAKSIFGAWQRGLWRVRQTDGNRPQAGSARWPRHIKGRTSPWSATAAIRDDINKMADKA